MFIAVENSRELGVVRFDDISGENIISITIAPGFRGKGFGSRIISESLNICSHSTAVTAYIDQNNISSVKAFERVGFVKKGTKRLNGKEFLRYEYH